MVAPTITIDGRDVSPRMIRSARHVAIANVRIDWGRETHFDKPKPGVATVRIINRGIDTTPPRKGQDIRVTYPSFGDVFRGTIAEADTTTDYITHANGLREKITETVITAHDTLANYAQYLPAGPVRNEGGSGAWTGPGGWFAQYISGRLDEIMKAGAGRFVDAYSRPSSIVQTSPEVQAYVGPRRPADDSALDLIHGACSLLGPLGSFTYAPHEHRLYTALVQPAAHAVVTLTPKANGGLGITLPTDVYNLPAGLVEIETTDLEAPADEVAVARIEYVNMDEITPGVEYEYSIAAATRDVPGAASARTYVAPERTFYPVDAPGAPFDSWRRYIDWWLTQATNLFAATNTTAQLPPLVVDPEDATVAATGQSFHTYQRGRSFYLNGSMFNGEPGAPAVVAIIGGTLTYDAEQGWRHAFITAPTAGGAPAPLTLDQMFPSTSTDRLDAWDANLTINDLAAVNRRA